MTHAAAGRLVGWKRIASHLGCAERTARRWEAEEGLPVKRQAHESKSTVYALPGELDEWLASRAPAAGGPVELQDSAPLTAPLPAPPPAARRDPLRIARGIAVLALALGMAVFATFFLLPRQAPPAPGDLEAAALTEDPVAADLYRRGVLLWEQRGEAPNRRAVTLLTAATKRDEDFAQAWAALASAWATLPTYAADISADGALDEALLAADRALALDPSLTEPRTVMASIAQRRGDWQESERIFETALAADPDNATILLWYAGHYRELGMMGRAKALTDRARAIAPQAPPILSETAMNTLQGGDVEGAEAMLDFIWYELGAETPIVWTGKWFAADMRGDRAAMDDWLDRKPFEAQDAVFLAYSEARHGGGDALAAARSIAAAHESGFPGWLAYYLLSKLGQTDAALDLAEKEAASGPFENSVVLFDASAKDARATARFAALTARLGFTEYWRSAGPPDVCDDENGAPFCRDIRSAP